MRNGYEVLMRKGLCDCTGGDIQCRNRERFGGGGGSRIFHFYYQFNIREKLTVRFSGKCDNRKFASKEIDNEWLLIAK